MMSHLKLLNRVSETCDHANEACDEILVTDRS